MPIPEYQSLMLPLLRFAQDDKEHSSREAIESLANELGLSEEERKEMLPSGTARLFDNRVAWANTYIKKAKLIESTRRGHFKITERGKKVLSENPSKIDRQYLNRFPEFIEFLTPKKQKEIKPSKQIASAENTPEEVLENAYEELQDTLASELLQTIKQCSPDFFERLVIDVLIKMGYGGSRKEAGQAMGRSGDEGIDGIIKEDKLGLDVIYIQAKRWDNSVVGRPEIQKFAGALIGQKARKGIFITTSSFSKDALQYVKNIENKIILIDGQQLSELMIDYNVGVSPVASYEIKKLDMDYFTDE